MLSEPTNKTYQKLVNQFLRKHPETMSPDASKETIAYAVQVVMHNAASRGPNVFYKWRAAMYWVFLALHRNAPSLEQKNQIKALAEEFRDKTMTYAQVRGQLKLPMYESKTSDKRRKKLKSNTVDRLYAAAKPREKALIELLVATGMRPVEIVRGAHLEITDDGILRVHVTGAKKTSNSGADRVLNIDLDVLEARFGELHITAYENTADLYNSDRTLQDNMKRTADRAGLKDICAYRFRHQFRSTYSAQADTETVATAMGHQSTRSQEIYGRRQSGDGITPIINVEGPKPRNHREPDKDEMKQRIIQNDVEFLQ